MYSDPNREVLKATFDNGNYKTTVGLSAVVARVRPLFREGAIPTWVLYGAISHGGVLVFHSWNSLGKSHSGNTMYDLMRSP
jgi:hypothetical protein